MKRMRMRGQRGSRRLSGDQRTGSDQSGDRLATANYDSVPLVCFTGQVARHLIGNDAFQEVDIVGITRSITKYGVTVTKREDLGRIIKEAFYIARTGRPGPVLIDLPKDVMAELGSCTVSERGEYQKDISRIPVYISDS